MKSFKIDKSAKIVCEWAKTRTAFKHIAILFVGGKEHSRVKICYLNRTWESFQFESVLTKLLNQTKYLTQARQRNFLAKARHAESERVDAEFKTIGTMAKLGEIFHAGDKKAQNDWKKRMLKAGLKNKGLIMPDDWEKLSEDEKTNRLDAVISQLTNKKIK